MSTEVDENTGLDSTETVDKTTGQIGNDAATDQPTDDTIPAGQEIGDGSSEAGQADEKSSDGQAPEKQPPPAPTFDAELTDRAKAYQIGSEDLKQFKTPEDLDLYLSRLDRQIGRIVLDRNRAQQADANAGTVQERPTEAAAKKDVPTPPSAPQVDPEFKIELDPDQYDQGLVGVLGGMNQHFSGRLGKLESLLGTVRQMNEQFQLMQANQREEAFDSFLNGLPEELVEFVGKGTADDLREGNKAAFEIRGKIWEEAKALRAAYAAQGRKVPEKAILDRAVRLVLGDKQEEIARRKVAKDVSNRRAQFANRPSKPKPVSDGPADEREAAVAEIDAMLKEIGAEV